MMQKSNSGGYEVPLKIKVVLGPKLVRADVRMVVGFVPAGVLIDHTKVPHLDPRTGKGYQRLPQATRVNELAVDLRKGRVDLPTSVLLSLRGRDSSKYIEDEYLDLGSVISDGGVFYVVDGQHRILALKKLVEDGNTDWLSHELAFTCMIGANEREEMEQFYLVNSKSKSVRTDLAYELLYQRAQDPEVFEALVERGQDWQVHAQSIVKALNEDSPVWRDKIRFASMDKGRTVIPSASMINSLKSILSSSYFKALSEDQKIRVIDAFWGGVRIIFPDAFDEPSDYSIQKGIGVTVLHSLLMQVVEIVKAQGNSPTDAYSYADVLREPLNQLQGETSNGAVVSGLDFWRAAPDGAAGSYSSSAGKRVLIAKIQVLLPKIEIQ